MLDDKTYYEIIYEEKGKVYRIPQASVPASKKKDICRMELQMDYLKDKSKIRDYRGHNIWLLSSLLILLSTFFIDPVVQVYTVLYNKLSSAISIFSTGFGGFSGIVEFLSNFSLFIFIIPAMLGFVVFIIWRIFFNRIIKNRIYRKNLKRAKAIEREYNSFYEAKVREGLPL